MPTRRCKPRQTNGPTLSTDAKQSCLMKTQAGPPNGPRHKRRRQWTDLRDWPPSNAGGDPLARGRLENETAVALSFVMAGGPQCLAASRFRIAKPITLPPCEAPPCRTHRCAKSRSSCPRRGMWRPSAAACRRSPPSSTANMKALFGSRRCSGKSISTQPTRVSSPKFRQRSPATSWCRSSGRASAPSFPPTSLACQTGSPIRRGRPTSCSPRSRPRRPRACRMSMCSARLPMRPCRWRTRSAAGRRRPSSTRLRRSGASGSGRRRVSSRPRFRISPARMHSSSRSSCCCGSGSRRVVCSARG